MHETEQVSGSAVWVSELKAFYKAGPDAADRQEDLDWQALAAQAFERDD